MAGWERGSDKGSDALSFLSAFFPTLSLDPLRLPLHFDRVGPIVATKPMASSITDVTSQLGGRRSAADPYQREKRKKGPDEQFFGRPSVLYLVISRH